MGRDELESVGRLYECHAAAVHGYALRRSDRETADEVTAQVFLVAWRRRSSVPADALPWLYGVARRVLADQRRGASRRRRLGERLRGTTVEAASGPAADPAGTTRDHGLAAALKRLSMADREALLLRYWEELEPAQIARVLGCSRAAAAVRLHRARERLARELQRDLGKRGDTAEQERQCLTRTEPS